jgi:hypothetical protein
MDEMERKIRRKKCNKRRTKCYKKCGRGGKCVSKNKDCPTGYGAFQPHATIHIPSRFKRCCCKVKCSDRLAEG